MNMQVKQKLEFIHYFPLVGRYLGIYAESKAWARVTTTWGGKSTVPPPFSDILLLWCHMVWNTPLATRVCCHGSELSQLLVHSQPTHWQSSMRNWEGLDAVSNSWMCILLMPIWSIQRCMEGFSLLLWWYQIVIVVTWCWFEYQPFAEGEFLLRGDRGSIGRSHIV